MVECEAQVKVTHEHGLPALRGLEPDKRWVDQGHDRQGNLASGTFLAAEAAGRVIRSHLQKVLVGDQFAVAGSLRAPDHKHVFGADLLLLALLFLEFVAVVLDLPQVQRHNMVGRPASIAAFFRLAHHDIVEIVVVTVSLKSHALDDPEVDLRYYQLTLCVVDFHVGAGLFLGRVDILGEGAFELAGAFAAAAAHFHVDGVFLVLHLFEVDWLLSDCEHLLVLHLVVIVGADHLRLDVVLDLGLGLFSFLLVLDVEAGRQALLQVEVERDAVVPWLQTVVRNLKHVLLVVGKLLFLFALL